MASQPRIEIGPNEYFPPFAGRKRIDLSTVESDTIEDLTSRKIKFDGIFGEVVLAYNLHKEGLLLADRDDVATPLGPVAFRSVSDNGKVKFTELPLHLNLDLYPRTVDQYEKLKRYKAELDFRGQTFYMDCSGDEDTDYEGVIAASGMEIVINNAIYDSNGMYKNILLPSDIGRLALMRLRFVEQSTPPASSPPSRSHLQLVRSPDLGKSYKK